MEVYVTRSNAERIIKKMDIKGLDISEFAKQMQFKWFNKWELCTLNAYELFFSNPAQFVSQCSELKSREIQQFFVHRNSQPPSYHYFDSCKRMLSNYENIRIPDSILSSGREEEFINWCSENEELRAKYPDQFRLRLKYRFKVTENVDVNIENSGYQAFEALTLSDVESAISKKLEKTQQWLASAHLNREVMEVFGIQSFNYKEPERIKMKRLTIQASIEQVVNCLTYIELVIKRPLVDLFKVYYRLKENEGLAFNENLLEHIGFRVCTRCSAQKSIGTLLNEHRVEHAA